MGDRSSHHDVSVFAAIALAAALACAPRSSTAETVQAELDPEQRTSLERYAGTYRYAQEHDHGRAIVKRAMEEALAQIPRIFRSLVRRHLEKRDYFVTSFSIRQAGDRIAFRAMSYKAFSVATHPGVTKELTSKSGNVTKVTQHFRDGRFEQTLENRRGKQHNLFTLLDDDTVLVRSTFTSRYLDRPVQFELTYDRASPRRPPPEKRNPRERPPTTKRRWRVIRPGSLKLIARPRVVMPARKAFRPWRRGDRHESMHEGYRPGTYGVGP